MQLLEKVAQDVKTVKDYTPCAPDFFRWVVIGGYLVVVLSAVGWGLFVMQEQHQKANENKDKQRLQQIAAELADVQRQTAEAGKLKNKYEEWDGWLKGNYALSRFFSEVFGALPQGARLQELELNESPGRQGSFRLKMRFFGQGENRVMNTQDLEDKLTELGANWQEGRQSVSEGGKMEMEAPLLLPREFYPAGGGTVSTEALPMPPAVPEEGGPP